jgi:hypothetical protein
MNELGMRNEDLGIPTLPLTRNVLWPAGVWAAFLIPNSYFLIESPIGRLRILV